MLRALSAIVIVFLLLNSGEFSSRLGAITAQVSEKEIRSKVEYKTKFDSEQIPGQTNDMVTFPLSNSRQILRTQSGHWLLAFDVSGKGLFLCYGIPSATQGSQFSQPILLVGSLEKGVFAKGSDPAGISLAIHNKTLHLAWSDRQGIWLLTTPVPNFESPDRVETFLRQRGAPQLVISNATLGDISTDLQGNVVLAYHKSEGISVATRSDNIWRQEKATEAGRDPVIEFDNKGQLHMAYLLQTETPFFGPGRLAMNPHIMYAVRNSEGWQHPQTAAHGLSFFPSIAVADNQPIIAYQFEGHKRVRGRSQQYVEQREGGGSSVGYAALREGHWGTGFVSKAGEIVVRDDSVADAFQGRIYPSVEEKWRPKMAVDKHGIPWVFWPDTTRRHTYFARWLGSRFSDECEVRGGYYAPSDQMAVEKHMPLQASALGFAYAAAGRLYFGTVPVPSASVSESRHFLFLDMLEAAELQGLDRRLNQFTKYRDNPVLTRSSPGNWDDFGLNFPNVHHDQGKFKMDYAGHGSSGAAGKWDHGYAESEDGIRWTRPPLGLIEMNGSRDNNLVPWIPHFRDAKEADPNKRFKGVWISGHARWITDFSRRLAFSPDAIHWEAGQETVNLTSLLEGGGPCFRDDLDIPERRFKAVGRTISQGHRALGMMWSPDLVHWHGNEAILDVDDPYGKPAQQWRGRYVANRILDPSGEKSGDQIYWGNVWIENGLYLCLYAPYQFDGGYQAAFAVSRDGFNYVRVKNGEFILPRGQAGAWDSGIIAVGYGIGIPMRVGEKVRVYYGGNTSHHGTDPLRASAAVGFAELRPDGWTYVVPSPDATVSYATTIPFDVNSAQTTKLFLNAETQPGRGEIRVEILDAITKKPFQGYAKLDCRPVSKNSIVSQVSWKQTDLLPKNRKKIRLRFYLRGLDTRLYSFWFESATKVPPSGQQLGSEARRNQQN